MKQVLLLMAVLCQATESFAATKFIAKNDDRCFLDTAVALASFSQLDHLLCSWECTKNQNCGMFMLRLSSQTCMLYEKAQETTYSALTEVNSGQCAIWIKSWIQGFSLFTANGSFTVPPGVTVLKVLAVGGGAGGCAGNVAAGGSGFVAYGLLNVSAGQQFQVTVGRGGANAVASTSTVPDCNVATNGGTSSFGSLVVAQGGIIAANGNGAAGGSGGGAGAAYLAGCLSGSGGSAGSAGTAGNTTYTPGAGQGASFTSPFSQFKLTNFSAGKGAAGLLGTEPYRFGGGGAGGVLVNGTGPNGGAGGCCTSDSTKCGPGSATGYGASGSSGCRDESALRLSVGGPGAAGLVYVEY